MGKIVLNYQNKDEAALCASHDVKNIEELQKWLVYELQRKTEVYLKQQQQLTLPPIEKPVITFDSKI